MESYGEYNDKGVKKRYLILDKIDNPLDAYLMGYLYGDGGFIKNRGFSFIMVSSIDLNIITKFRDRYCPNNKIYNVGKKSSKKVKSINDVYELRFPPKFSKQLDKFGLFCYKKDRKIKGITPRFFINILHGLIDSDGFWTVSTRKDCRQDRLRCFITHRSEHFLRDVQRLLENVLEVSSSIYPHVSNNCYRLSIQNTEKCRKIAQSILFQGYEGNATKSRIIYTHLNKYEYALPKSDELLENPVKDNQQPSLIDEEGSETT